MQTRFFSAYVPRSTMKAIMATCGPGEVTQTVVKVLERYAGKLATTATKRFRRILPHLEEEWIRLALRVPEPIYEEIVEASRQTGIGRQRIVGVILVSEFEPKTKEAAA